MDSSKTITEIKSSFVRNQIRILSVALTPSEDWHDYGPASEDNIPDKIVEDVLQKFFSSQAIHHVARQIENLYWNSVDPETGGELSQGLVIEKGTDLSNSMSIARLPEQWSYDGNDDVGEDDKVRFESTIRSSIHNQHIIPNWVFDRYEQLRLRLLELDKQRKKQQERLTQYRLLRELLEPFKDPQMNIQPNLVTRDSPLGQEIDRMRMLVAKVTSRVGRGGRNVELEGASQSINDHDAKLSAVLDMT
ncbi:conserved hypothetical protein [Histoplasma capsulatum G186AR]|uniref:Kinetochore protein fta4 n=1 Tax=Ajellomyces capsulatus (strain G186AR / H82 / ATCC MYA-2454 / RMSCC 2432) TaxID=447093 RepID=C0NRD7_AJECG|nr:uncharacterized protein HCBG_05567 [Histoplasma capsulatum G186AR]EEH06251.1 conserved hypothetical protein [Histoplasma capsulatum G186AR]